MTNYRWIPESVIRIAHDDQIKEHGGSYGVLNENALLSTLAKPQHLLAYGENVTLFDLAAAYGYGFIKNHCFVDGNKRIALIAVNIFLILNGYQLTVSEEEAVIFFIKLAETKDTPESGQILLVQWIRQNSKPRK